MLIVARDPSIAQPRVLKAPYPKLPWASSFSSLLHSKARPHKAEGIFLDIFFPVSDNLYKAQRPLFPLSLVVSVRDAGVHSEAGEEEDSYSNKATSGSSDLGSEDSALVQPPSRSSDRGPRRSLTRRHTTELEADRRTHQDTLSSTDGIPQLGGNSLRGLTPPPLPPAMLPDKKRSLGEVLRDESPPQQDKMAAEIERLAKGELSSFVTEPGSSGTQTVGATHGHRRKRSKVAEESATPQVMPLARRDSNAIMDGHKDKPQERRSERIRNAARNANHST
ncbi:hypothetical protein F5Y19DRAFT_86388 [Xylariaceae sp. FL1651]|nr:hypothetical protein F5Y19DRAFT_86388 [Xylariaceae sp. FL1651]